MLADDPFKDSGGSGAPAIDATEGDKLEYLKAHLYPDGSGPNHDERSAPGILDLPDNVLEQILCEAGLPVNMRINIQYGRKAPNASTDNDEWWFGNTDDNTRHFDAEIVRAVFKTCKRFYQVGSTIVYRDNHIAAHWRNGETLSGLANLSNHAISNLRKILIILNNTAPVLDNKAFFGAGIDRHQVDEPLSTKSPQFSELLAQWEHVTARLNKHLADDLVWIDFFCDCADIETAREIMEPFVLDPVEPNAPGRRLKHCLIRLSHKRDTEMQKLAREKALDLVRKPHDTYGDPFPFMRLPSELRQTILEYTDLVTPRQEVEWNPTEKFHIRTLGNYVCPHCKSYLCSHGYHPRTIHWFMYGVLGRNPRSFCGHFCSAFEASSGRFFSPISQTCLCWHHPQALFLVSKEFLHDARATFYRRNRFLIKARGDVLHSAIPCDERSEISRFLSEQVPTTAMHALKHVEILYPWFEEHGHFTRMTDAANADLRATLKKVKSHLNIPNLTICIRMADYNTYQPSDRSIWRYTNIDPDIAPHIMKAETEAVKCWSELVDGGLRRLFVFLYRPWNWENCVQPDDGAWHTLTTHQSYDANKAAGIEQWMEKQVMGQDYDCWQQGARRVPKPTWAVELGLRTLGG